MVKIISNGDGSFTLLPGAYAITTSEDGSHPDGQVCINAEHHDADKLTLLDYLLEGYGVEMLAIGTGRDRRGAEKRVVVFNGDGVLAGQGSGLVLTTVDTLGRGGGTEPGDHFLKVTVPTIVSLADGVLTIGERTHDLKRPGAFACSADGMLLDMSDSRIADALAHGPDTEFDEHGMRVAATEDNLPALRGIGDPVADAFADTLEKTGHVLLYHTVPQGRR